MKKSLIVVLSMLFVLGLTASVFAAEETAAVAKGDTKITLGGEIRVRGWYQDNITSTAGARADSPSPYGGTEGGTYGGRSMAWYDQRVRLSIDAQVTPNVTGRIHLETMPENWVWGNASTTAASTTAASTVGAAGNGGLKAGTELRFLEAWIAYKGTGLLGVPAGIKAGHQLIKFGEGTFFDHTRYGDDAILLFVEPAKGTDIALATLKLYESSTSDNTDDIDAYSLLFTHKLDKDNTIGANYTRVQSGKLDGTGNIAVYRIPGATGSYRNASIGLSNVGLFGKGKVAGFGYKATVDLQFGKIKEITGLTMTEQKFSGYGITAGGDYKVDPVTLRANFVYGSGDSDATDTAGNTKNKAFQTFVGNVVDPNLPTVVYNWRVETAAGSGLRGTGIANTTAYNIGLTYPATKDLTLALDYYLLRASKALSTTVDTLGYSKKIGSEVDLKVAYKIAKNLTYGINSGILFAGDYYKRAATGVTSDPKNAFVLQHGLTLSF